MESTTGYNTWRLTSAKWSGTTYSLDREMIPFLKEHKFVFTFFCSQLTLLVYILSAINSKIFFQKLNSWKQKHPPHLEQNSHWNKTTQVLHPITLQLFILKLQWVRGSLTVSNMSFLHIITNTVFLCCESIHFYC